MPWFFNFLISKLGSSLKNTLCGNMFILDGHSKLIKFAFFELGVPFLSICIEWLFYHIYLKKPCWHAPIYLSVKIRWEWKYHRQLWTPEVVFLLGHSSMIRVKTCLGNRFLGSSTATKTQVYQHVQFFIGLWIHKIIQITYYP